MFKKIFRKSAQTVEGRKTIRVFNGVDETEIEVIRTLGLAEAISFIEFVVSSVFDEEDGSYTPHAYDFAIKVATVQKYTNLKTEGTLEEAYHLLYNTDIYDRVVDEVNIEQYCELLEAADKKIAYLLAQSESAAANKTQDLIVKIEELSEKMSEAFGDVSRIDFSAITKGVSAMSKLDGQDLTNAVLNIQKEIEQIEQNQ